MMAGGFSTLDTSFPNLEGQSAEQQLKAVTDYLYQLLEQLRYTLRNLGTENMNEQALQDIVSMSAKAIDLTGYVTFHSLATAGETVIDGGNITTGTLSADRIGANSIHLGKLGSDVTGSFGDDNPDYIQPTYIDETEIRSPTIKAGDFYGCEYHDYDSGGNSFLTMKMTGDANYGGMFYIYNNRMDTPMFKVESYVYNSTLTTTFYINGEPFLTSVYDGINISISVPTAMKFSDAVLLNSGYGYGSSLPGGGTNAPNWTASEKSANTGRVFFLI